MLYWQVTHQAAVKSTNTGRPLATKASAAPGAQGCQPCAAVAVASAGAAATSAMRVTWGPKAHSSKAMATVATLPSQRRVRPCKASDQASRPRPTSRISSEAAPSMPLCWPSTHTSHTTVANMGKAMKRRKVSIHAPGRGRARATAGHRLAAR